MKKSKSGENRLIPATNEIVRYMHCGKCLDELPDGVSPKEWSQVQVGFTPLGIQLWCNRHEVNIAHIDFQGQKHPACTTTAKKGVY